MSAERAYSLLTITKADSEARVIEGFATTPALDRHGDIVEPLGGKWKLPLPFIHQHDHRSPLGWVEWLQATAEGVRFRARLAKVAEPGKLRDRLETAWSEIKAGLVRAVSIGFRPLEVQPIASGVRVTAWEMYELSAVTVPANVESTIHSVKMFDAAAAKAGNPCRVVRLSDPPVPQARRSSPVVRLADAESHPITAAALAAIDRVGAQRKEAKRIASMAFDEHLQMEINAATAHATDAEFAALRRRLDALERRK